MPWNIIYVNLLNIVVNVIVDTMKYVYYTIVNQREINVNYLYIYISLLLLGYIVVNMLN